MDPSLLVLTPDFGPNVVCGVMHKACTMAESTTAHCKALKDRNVMKQVQQLVHERGPEGELHKPS